MRLGNTTMDQDAILSCCEAFGGNAAECARIAEELDLKLIEALDAIEYLKDQVKEEEL